MKEKNIPSTIKFSPELQGKIAEAAKKTGLPKQEIIRLCTAIGIEDLRKVNWNLAKVISDAAESKKPPLQVIPGDEPLKNGTEGRN